MSRKRTRTIHGTVFDSVFRSIAQKMPTLMIPLINEVFGTNYPDNVEMDQLRNEFMEKSGKIITDSIFRIHDKIYHLECQSKPDDTMAIRMFEYDFAIALEHSGKDGEDYFVVDFPESAVLYLRQDKIPGALKTLVRFPDGRSFEYSTKVIDAQAYTEDDIFQKRLLCLLPYYLLRYEKMLKAKGKDPEEYGRILEECETLITRLEGSGITPSQQEDLLGMTQDIIDHILAKDSATKKEVKSAMGGRILELYSEKKARLARRAEKAEAKLDTARDRYILERLSDGTAKTRKEAEEMAKAIFD